MSIRWTMPGRAILAARPGEAVPCSGTEQCSLNQRPAHDRRAPGATTMPLGSLTSPAASLGDVQRIPRRGRRSGDTARFGSPSSSSGGRRQLCSRPPSPDFSLVALCRLPCSSDAAQSPCANPSAGAWLRLTYSGRLSCRKLSSRCSLLLRAPPAGVMRLPAHARFVPSSCCCGAGLFVSAAAARRCSLRSAEDISRAPTRSAKPTEITQHVRHVKDREVDAGGRRTGRPRSRLPGAPGRSGCRRRPATIRRQLTRHPRRVAEPRRSSSRYRDHQHGTAEVSTTSNRR